MIFLLFRRLRILGAAVYRAGLTRALRSMRTERGSAVPLLCEATSRTVATQAVGTHQAFRVTSGGRATRTR